MKQFICFLLFLITVTEEISGCQKHFTKTEIVEPYYRPYPMRPGPTFYYSPRHHPLRRYPQFPDKDNTQWHIQSATITCANISSLSEISHQHFVREDYDQYLNFTNSNVSTIPSSAFAGIYVITKLYLSQMHIKNIQPEAFKNLTNLQELHLDNNELTDLANGVFSHLHNLKVLNLNNNKLCRVGSWVFADLGNLTKLYLQNNRLPRIDDDFLQTLKHLKVLDLTGNPLRTIPKHSYSLEELSLADVLVSQFSVNLSQSNLTSLNLSSNHMSIVDFSLFPKGCSLFLAHNKISVWQNINMLNVSDLNLEYNGISTIKEAFRNVKKLHLAHNKLESLEGLFFNKSDVLQTLNLRFNKISTIKNDTFSGLSSLTHLNLGHNGISKIDTDLFKDLTSLKFLYLSHNKIEKFKFGTFDTLKNLELLDISQNNLVDLHQYTFNSLSQLRDLRFDSNQISNFDVGILTEHLPYLRLVSLNHNPWNCKDLVTTEKTLLSRGVSVEWGDTFDIENFHGISCINRGKFEENLNDSKIMKILNNFKQQPIQITHNSILSVGIVIQILISSSLLVIIFLIFVILRDKLRLNRNTSELLSQMDL